MNMNIKILSIKNFSDFMPENLLRNVGLQLDGKDLTKVTMSLSLVGYPIREFMLK